jgi:hypothetical protein
MNTLFRHTLGRAVRIGFIGGIVAVFLCLIGIVEIFGKRSLIEGLVSLGHIMLYLPLLATGYVTVKRTSEHAQMGKTGLLLAGGLSGLLSGATLAIFMWVGDLINIRAMFIHASPTLYDMLSFGLGMTGTWLLPLVGAFLGVLGVFIRLLPPRIQQPAMRGFMGILLVGLFAGLVRPLLVARPGLSEALGRFLFGETGLTQADRLRAHRRSGCVLVFTRKSHPRKV